ncbi:hypothetical protein ACSLNB_22790, partial [Citrobacter portucalensis]
RNGQQQSQQSSSQLQRQQQQRASAPQASEPPMDFDDDIPFAPLTTAAESFSAIAPNILQFSHDVFSFSPNPVFAGIENDA